MASNLRIGHVGNVIDSTTMASTLTAKTGFEVNNLLRGSRASGFWSSNSGTTCNTDFEASTSFKADFFFVGNAKLTFDISGDTGIDFNLWSDTSTSYANNHYSQTLTSSSFLGPRGEDIAINFTKNTSSHDYHRIRTSVSPASPHRYSFIIICELFDFGRDPIANFQASQSFIPGLQRHKQKELTLTWKGVSNEKLNTFKGLILKWADMSPIVLYETNDAILQGDKALLCNIIRYDARGLTSNTNEVRLTVKETV